MKFLLLTLVLLEEVATASVIKKRCSSCSDPTPCHVPEPHVHIPCHSCRPHKQRSKFRPGLCETGWTYYQKTGACYKAFFEASFDKAEKFCRRKQGHLASIHSYEENLFVAALAKTGKRWTDHKDYTWIGLKQANYPKNKNWIWTDGTKVDYLTFANGQPDNAGSNEHCTQLFGDLGSWPYLMWNDAPCTDWMRSFVCKKKARTFACT